MSEKSICFRETTRSFKYEWLLLLPWLCYSPSEDVSYCFSCVLFGHDFPTKASRVKNLFSQLFRARASAVSYFRARCEDKKKSIDPSHDSGQAFIFQHGLDLKLFFLKSKARVMKLICYVIENMNMRLKKIVKY